MENLQHKPVVTYVPVRAPKVCYRDIVSVKQKADPSFMGNVRIEYNMTLPTLIMTAPIVHIRPGAGRNSMSPQLQPLATHGRREFVLDTIQTNFWSEN